MLIAHGVLVSERMRTGSVAEAGLTDALAPSSRCRRQVTEKNPQKRTMLFLEITYREVSAALKNGKQARAFIADDTTHASHRHLLQRRF